jgi:GAF domain-containing protein
VTIRAKDIEPFAAELVAMAEDVKDGADEAITWVILTPGGPSGAAEQVVRRESLARALVELTALPLHQAETREILNATARICKEGLGEGFQISLCAGPPSEPDLVASSDRLAQQMDGAQMLAGEGPCHQAWETSEQVVSPDIHADERWPGLRRQLDSMPVKSAVAAPVRVGAKQAGELNVYSLQHDVTDPELLKLVDLLSTAVAAVLNEIGAKADLETLATQLRTALESRATIEQAKGMVMTTMGCGPDAAFEYLSKISKDTNVKVRQVAADMVARAYTDSPDTGCDTL